MSVPGARESVVHFTDAPMGPAAGAVHNAFRASRHGAYPAGPVKDAVAASLAAFRPYPRLFRHTHEAGVDSGKERHVGVTFGNKLHAASASKRQNGIVIFQ